MVCPRCWGSAVEPASSLPARLFARRAREVCRACGGRGERPDRQLSEHFALSEFVVSETAVRRGIANDPAPEAEGQLGHIVHALEVVRAKFGPVLVTSGYRSAALNAAVGGSSTSAHRFGVYGAAVDFKVQASPSDVVSWVRASSLAFDQVIDEPGWTHLGVFGANNVQRRQALRMRRSATGAAVYSEVRS